MNWEFAIRYLKAVEKKHEGFFIANDLKILECVVISGTRVVGIEIDEPRLTDEIISDINSMFWLT